MGIEFTINPILYFALIFLESYGMYLIISKLTGLNVKIERVIKLTVILTIVIFLTDVFVFQFHKTVFRSIIILVYTLIYYKSVGKISLLKSLICTFFFFGIALTIDMFIQFIMKAALVNIGMNWLFDNFAYAYILYIAIVYAIGSILSLSKTSLVKLDKIGM